MEIKICDYMYPCPHVVYMHMKLIPARFWTLQVRVKTVPAPNPLLETLVFAIK